MEADRIKCGLKFSETGLRVSDSKNFGPEKYRSTSAEAVCDFRACPLNEGVEIIFATMVDESKQVLFERLEGRATTPGDVVNRQLGQARLKYCIAYKVNLANPS